MAVFSVIQAAASDQFPVVWKAITLALSGIGLLKLSLFLFRLASVLLQTFVLPGISLNKFGARQGAWAVVTGASDGIGKEFSLQLAQAGFNIFLVARNKTKLDSVASEIQKKYPGVSTRIHTIDLSTNDDAPYVALAAAFQNLRIGVLVNNAGVAHSTPAYFIDAPLEEIKDIVAVNVNATTRVTYTVLPAMVQRRQGLILNIGSFAGAVPTPLSATYSGSKAFVTTFSAALAEEVKQYNIVVENVNTYFVVSKMSKMWTASVATPAPPAYVRSVLSKVGLACGAAQSGRPNTTTPYWGHALMDYGISLIGIPTFFIKRGHVINLQRRRERLEEASKAK